MAVLMYDFRMENSSISVLRRSFPLLDYLDIEKICDLIECKLCCDCLEKSVKILPCRDSFCDDCLQNYCRENQKDNYAPCPHCGEMFEIPHGGCANISTNEFARMVKSIMNKCKQVLLEDLSVRVESPEVVDDCLGSRISSGSKKKLHRSHEEDSVTGESISRQNASIEGYDISREKQFSICEISNDVELSCNLDDLQGREISGNDESKTRKNVEIGDCYVEEMTLYEKEHTGNDTLSEGNYTHDEKLDITDDEMLGVRDDAANASSLNEDDEKEDFLLFSATDDDKLRTSCFLYIADILLYIYSFMYAFQKTVTYDRKHTGLRTFGDGQCSNETRKDEEPVSGDKFANEISGTLFSSKSSGNDMPILVEVVLCFLLRLALYFLFSIAYPFLTGRGQHQIDTMTNDISFKRLSTDA